MRRVALIPRRFPNVQYTYGEVKDLMMSLKAYQTWINKSRKNDQITYYRGYIVEPSIQPIAPTHGSKEG